MSEQNFKKKSISRFVDVTKVERIVDCQTGRKKHPQLNVSMLGPTVHGGLEDAENAKPRLDMKQKEEMGEVGTQAYQLWGQEGP